MKLIGSSTHVVSVPNGESRSVSVDAREYYFIARFGSSPNQYSYRKSEKFSEDAASGQVAQVSIALHTVPGLNFRTGRSSAAVFNSVAVSESRAARADAGVPSSIGTSGRFFASLRLRMACFVNRASVDRVIHLLPKQLDITKSMSTDSMGNLTPRQL